MSLSPKMSIEELQRFLVQSFPQVADDYVVEAVGPMAMTVRFSPSEKDLRPGGTVSGPAMFALADVGVYLALLAMIGPEALAVTTNASLDFMRKPMPDKDLVADVRLLKVGRVLAVGDVLIRSEGMDDPVARASMTYSIPPSRA